MAEKVLLNLTTSKSKVPDLKSVPVARYHWTSRQLEYLQNHKQQYSNTGSYRETIKEMAEPFDGQ